MHACHNQYLYTTSLKPTCPRTRKESSIFTASPSHGIVSVRSTVHLVLGGIFRSLGLLFGLFLHTSAAHTRQTHLGTEEKVVNLVNDGLDLVLPRQSLA